MMRIIRFLLHTKREYIHDKQINDQENDKKCHLTERAGVVLQQ